LDQEPLKRSKQPPAQRRKINLMQRWFLILMLVLLPARGWSAQLMGIEMGTMQMAHAQKSAAHHASMPKSSAPMSDLMAMTDMPADCPMHKAASAQDVSANTNTSADQQHPTCQACQLCMPLAVLGHTGFTLGHQRCLTPLPQARMSFVSAELALAVKPPIR
jgi:hypothetical protein